jgi:crotonobetainyl-CoA:carnitine CoA-transferase CaiB-like acyl-CoA transferase
MFDRSGADTASSQNDAVQLDVARGPLSGIRVLDLTSYLAGPYGCALLGDMGAEVIKIEAPQGDMMRHYPSTIPNESRSFIGTNRNKFGIVIDLKKEDGLITFLDLVRTADVVVHNFRPSVPSRLKIDYARLSEINPRLVYCGITGFGDTGPLANNAGFDQVLQCLTGLCTFQGGEGNEPEIVMGSVVDYYTSSLMAFGVASALFQREKDGKGQYVGASLLRSAITMQSGRFVWAQDEDRSVNRDIRLAPLTGIHPTKEGYLYISSHSKHFWDALCDHLDMQEFKDDPRFDTMGKRIANAAMIVPRLRAGLSKHTANEWAAIFGQHVPNAPVRALEDMFDHPQVIAQDLVTTYEHPVLGAYRGMTKPLEFSRTPGPPPFAAPTMGQHTEQILAKLGYSEDRIKLLKAGGAVA